MSILIKKWVYGKDSFIRLNIDEPSIRPLDLKKIYSRLKQRDHQVFDEMFHFPFLEDDLIESIDFIKAVFFRFNLEIKIDITIGNEIKNYQKELKNFDEFSSNAKKIRNNQFESISELHVKFEDFRRIIESGLKRKLYDLQFLSAFHMAYTVNSLNFSVPGSGKTSVVLAAYHFLKTKGIVNKLFVIGPLSSFQAWEREYDFCFGEFPSVKRFSGVDNFNLEDKKNYLYSDNPSELNLIYYQGVDSIKEDLYNFMNKHKVMLVVDEAHRIKNADGKWGKNITKLTESAKSRVALTGTPIPNGYEDIYNIIKFIYPFKYKSIIKLHYSQLQDLSLPPRNEIGEKQLKENISPFFMRIRKEDLPNLPLVNEKSVVIPMGNEQQEIYDYIFSITQTLKISSLSNSEADFLVRAILIRLRQAATNPYLLSISLESSIESSLFSDSTENYFEKLNIADEELFDFQFRDRVKKYYEKETSSKILYTINRVKKLLAENDETKILIWTVFTENTKYLKSELQKLGIKSELLIGQVETNYRELIVDSFNSKKSNLRVVIANPFTVGESVSLHYSCNYAIYLERDYNCSNFIQSKDRIHRVGSTFETVFYEYLISEHSVDQIIDDRLKLKVARMSSLIDDDIPFFKILEEENEESAIIKELLHRYSSEN